MDGYELCKNCGHMRRDHMDMAGRRAGFSASFIPNSCTWKMCSCKEFVEP